MLTLVAGLPLAWAIGRFRFRGRALARALVLVPFVLPTVVVATAFLAVLPDGYERGLWAILAAHVFFNVAVVTRIVGGAWATIDPRSAEAAAVLGAGPLRRAREVTLPQLAPALSAASALTFLFCFTSFGVILILGGPGRATRGDGDLQPGRAAVRPAGGGRAVAAAARRRCGRAHGGRHPRGTSGRRRNARRRERRAPPAARLGALRGRRRARGRGARAPLPARRPRRAVAGQLGRALRDDPRAPGRAVGGGRVLRLLWRASPRRSRSSSVGSRRSPWRGARPASSTASCCSPSAPPP